MPKPPDPRPYPHRMAVISAAHLPPGFADSLLRTCFDAEAEIYAGHYGWLLPAGNDRGDYPPSVRLLLGWCATGLNCDYVLFHSTGPVMPGFQTFDEGGAEIAAPANDTGRSDTPEDNPTYWTLVRHSRFRTKHDARFAHVVEMQTLSAEHIKTVDKAGGLVFATYREARRREFNENYPPGVTGLEPRARGRFVNRRGIGEIYIPAEPPRNDEPPFDYRRIAP